MLKVQGVPRVPGFPIREGLSKRDSKTHLDSVSFFGPFQIHACRLSLLKKKTLSGYVDWDTGVMSASQLLIDNSQVFQTFEA